MKKSICVIGAGFVGGSLATVFSERDFDVWSYDISGKVAQGARDPRSLMKISDVKDVVNVLEATQKNFSKVYFVCLPTPMYEDGEADLSIVEGVLEQLSKIPGNRIAVVKSTVPPGSTEQWNKMFEGTGLRVIFSPEFLTEANALDDMRNQNRIVLGGPRPFINKVKEIFQTAFPSVPLIKTSSTTAEMVKYFTNIHLAARVVLSCEFLQLCNILDNKGLNIDFDKVVEYSRFDKRLGDSHLNAPGHDGLLGARGHCFPKDLAALVYLSEKNGLNESLMSKIQEKNLKLVPKENRDWEKMHGRAVSKRNK